MTKNPFDQYDEPASSSNPFDQYDEGGGAGSGGLASDLGKSLKAGVQRLPGMATGLLDLPFALATGTRPVTTTADYLGKATGFQPGKWADETNFSQGYQASKKSVDDAWKGFDGVSQDQSASKMDAVRKLVSDAPQIAGAYLQNPSYTMGQVAESVPSIVAGGAISKVALAAGRVAGVAANATTGAAARAAAPGALARTVGDKWAVPVAAGIGEGAITTGDAMAHAQGPDQQKNALAALGAGVGTALLGAGSGRVANALGLETAETALARAGARAANGAATTPPPALLRRVLGGMVSEAVLQELPQSAQEQMWQNFADGKSLWDGVARAGTEGALAGGVMGVAANIRGGQSVPPPVPAPQDLQARSNAEAAAADAQARADAAQPAWDTAPGAADPNADRATGMASPANAPLVGGAEFSTSPGAGDPNANGLDFDRDIDTGTLAIDDRPLSEKMGLNPAAGPLSASASVAVDSGAYMPPAGMPGADPAAAPEADPMVLQNRDRTSAASIAQMQEIAANPDYLRVGPSRDMTSGAPIVFGEMPPTAILGRAETVVDGKGERMGTQYAVVDAGDLIASNNADGTTVAEYATGQPGKLRSVAGNGRTAGLQAAYGKGTAGKYQQELAADADALGIDGEALLGMKRPVLVRVMQESQVTNDMGDRTNITATQKLSPLEQAGNDARRLDVRTLAFDEGGNPTPDSIKGFVSAMPVAERGDMLNADGTPTRQAVDRLMAATFKQAFESDELVQLYAQATDPDARAVMAAAADASGVLANLKGAGEFDVRSAVADAAKMAVNAARQGLKLSDVLLNGDIDISPEAFPVAAFLAQNIRSPKQMAEGLRRWGQLALEQSRIAEENNVQGSLMGPTPTLTRAEIFARIGDGTNPAGQAIAPPAAARQAADPVQQPTPTTTEGTQDGPAPNQTQQAIAQPAQGAGAQAAAPAAVAAPAPRGENWRNNTIQAGRVARDLGLNPKGKKLQQMVQEIDAFDAKQNQASAQAGTAPAAIETVAEKGKNKAGQKLSAQPAQPESVVSAQPEPTAAAAPAPAPASVKEGLAQVQAKKGAEAKQDAAPAQQAPTATENVAPVVQDAPDLDLTAPTKAELLAKQEAQEAAAKQKAKDDAKIDAAQKAARDKKDVDARMDASADNFVLGQDADDAVSGQDAMFSRAPAKDQTQTAAFKEWFADSAVVDAQGQPLRVYHGTNADFTVFDLGRQGAANGLMFSQGFYFSEDPVYANMMARDKEGANVMPAYVSLQRPKIFQSYQDARKFPAGGWSRLPADGAHDGVIIMDEGAMVEVVAFQPEQVKSATGNSGAFDSGSADIRFSRTQAAEVRNLVTLHNLSEDSLLYADQLGGIPAPSIGITKVDSPFGGFGGITLIAPKGMIDPAAGVPVYDRDAWTARFPEMNFKSVSDKKANDFYERMKPAKELGGDGDGFESILWERIKNDSTQSPDKVMGLFRQYQAPRVLYAREVLGKEVKVPMRDVPLSGPMAQDKQLLAYWKANKATLVSMSDGMSTEDFRATPEHKQLSEQVEAALERAWPNEDRPGKREALRKMFREILFDKDDGLMSVSAFRDLGRDADKAGKKEIDRVKLGAAVDKLVKADDPAYLQWAQGLVAPLFDAPTITLRGREVAPTLDNLTQAMTVGSTEGVEKSMAFGAGKTAAMLGKRFKSLKEIQAARDQVVSQAQEQDGKKATDVVLDAYREAVLPFFTVKDWRGQIDTWEGNDAAMEALARAGKTGDSPVAIRASLAKMGFKSVDADSLRLAKQAIDALRNAATDYFEAKPQRAVKLNEFQGAVVPKGTSAEAMAVLEKAGIVVEEHGKAEGAREKAIQKLAKRLDKERKDVLFSQARATATTTPTAKSNERLVATQMLVDGLKEKWTRAPEIIVARNMQDQLVPQRVREYDAKLKSQGATGDVRGFIYGGQVFLLSDKLGNPKEIAETLYHEVLGHYGLRGAFGSALAPVLNQMATMRKADIAAKAREYGLFDKAALGGMTKAQASDAQILAAMSKEQKMEAAEEVLAELAQSRPEIGFVKRAVAAIRNWLRANVPGFKDLALTDADIIEAFIIPARGFVTRSKETGEQSIERAMGAFSRAAGQTAGTGRIRRTLDELVAATESQASWRTWYDRHDAALANLFGDDAKLFQSILSATSQAATVKSNVGLALKAYDQMLSELPFTGYLPAVIKNLDRIRSDQALRGAKISQYGEANEGNTEAIAVDRHISMLFFNSKTPNRLQIQAAKARIRKIAERLQWEPRQVQAALWAFNQTRLGTDPEQVQSYDTILENKADLIAALRARHQRGEGGSLPPGGETRTRNPEGRAGTEAAGEVTFSRAGATDQTQTDADEMLPAKNIRPLNLVEDKKKFEALVEGMARDGWTGRPVLVWKNGKKNQALTGSHRIAAARKVGIDVPVVFVSNDAAKWEDPNGMFTTFQDAIDDQRQSSFLDKAGDAKAANLMAQEDMDDDWQSVNQANPDIRFSRAPTAIESSMGALTPDQDAAYKTVAGVQKVPTFKERADAFKANLGLRMKQALVDQFAPIKDVSQEAYMLARMSKGSDGAVDALLMYGKPFLRDGVLDVNTADGGFAQVMAGLKGEHDRFFMWVAAQRAERLKAEGKENLMGDSDISALKTLNAGTMVDGTVRVPLYAKALQELNAFNEASLKVALQSGLIDQAAYDLMKDQPYVPFYRLMEDEAGMTGPRFSSGLLNQKAWKKLKGGTQQLNADLMQNALQNWSHLYAASARNRAALATMDAAEAMGVAYKVPAITKGSSKVMRDGKTEHWMVEDPYLLEAISALSYSASPLMKPLAKMKQILTFGVTVNPTFKIRNLIRDSLSSISQSELGYNPIKNVGQGWALTAKDSQVYASMVASGGVIRFGSQENTSRLRDQVAKLGGVVLDEGGLKKFTGQLKSLYDAYADFGDRTENVNRAALYDQLIKKGHNHAEASFIARDLMDFSMGGSHPAVRFLTQSVPFLNARLQGLYKLGRAAGENPRKFATVAGAVSLASLALLGAYSDDEDWKKREDWDRDAYWWFKVGGTAYRIPKPFELGAIGTLAERTAEAMFDEEMTGKRFMQRIGHMAGQTFALDPVPQAFKPLLDIYANKDSFTGRAIESQADQRLRPKDRYNERTSELARLLGGMGLPEPSQLIKGDYSPLSPKQVDHLIRGYFSWLGTATTTVSDFALRPAMDRGERPDLRLRDVFLAGNFVESLPTGSSRYVSQMYEQSRSVEQAFASYREALKQGDTEKAASIKEQSGDKLRNRVAYATATKQMSEINAQVKRVEANRLMPGEAKRERLNELDAMRGKIAARVAGLT